MNSPANAIEDAKPRSTAYLISRNSKLFLASEGSTYGGISLINRTGVAFRLPWIKTKIAVVFTAHRLRCSEAAFIGSGSLAACLSQQSP